MNSRIVSYGDET